MSLDATRWAWEQKVKGTQKLVLLSLADRADEKHCCYPSISRITNDTGLNRKTVMNCINVLENSGLIKTKKMPGNKNYYSLIGVKNRHETSTKNGTAASTNLGTSTKNGTSTKIGTSTSTKIGTTPVPKLGHKPTNNLSINLPEYIDSETFAEFLQVRKRLKAVNSERGIKVLLTEIEKIHKAGFDVNKEIDKAISMGWKTVYMPKGNPPQQTSGYREIA